MKTNLSFFTFIFLFVFVSNASAQISRAYNTSGMKGYAKMYKQENLGKTDYTCVYGFEVYDPTADRTMKSRMILVANKEVSLFIDYSSYSRDSVFNLLDRDKITHQCFDSVYAKYRGSYCQSCNIYKYHDKKIRYERGRVFTDNYIYSEPIESFHWEMSQDTLTILKHLCHKATTNFRGRDWTVWYAQDIPLSEGPWKFEGLPGLILKAESNDGEIRFIGQWVAYRKVDILRNITEQSDFKTTRQKYLKFQSQYKKNPANIMAGVVEVEGGMQNVHSLPYNPIEKE